MPPPEIPAALRFPKGFLFGASTAAYQIEGDNVHSDLWDWEAKRGWARSGKASNHWERWESDLQLAADLGLDAYRFSVEWARVFPRPDGKPDAAALDRYFAILERSKALGLRPFVCLHHFTHPAWLFRQHPELWADRGLVERFVEFAKLVAGALPARDWVPFNEPTGFAAMAYLIGHFPPGRRMALRTASEYLRGPVAGIVDAHRRVFALLKAKDPANRVGVAHNIAAYEPLKPGRDDAATRAWDELAHWGFLDALVKGRWDTDLDGTPETVTGEGSTLDFIGVNYYTRVFVRSAPGVLAPVRGIPLYPEVTVTLPLVAPLYRWLVGGRADLPREDMGREMYPDGLRKVLLETARRYPGTPITVTENGLSETGDAVRGPQLVAHLEAVKAAMDAGAEVDGFFYWSLFDNYEWGSFKPRFGLYRVDYENGFGRTLTRGGETYRELIRASR